MRNPRVVAPNPPELPLQSQKQIQDLLLVGEKPEHKNGTRVLYRYPNFLVLTAARSDDEPEPVFAEEPVPVKTGVLRSLLEKISRRFHLIGAKVQQQAASIIEVKPFLKEAALPALPATKTAAETPLPAPSNKKGLFSLVPLWLETLLVLVGLLIAGVAHAANMFNYPRYELDEGTYMSSAWAILNAMITAYPYGYGHPPLGWIQIAGWIQFTGGFFTFGNALNSGRVLMLLFALGCALLVYLIARQISNSVSISLFAMVISTLSPISLTYQRQVFLDNIGAFWFLLALYLVLASKSRLYYIVFAGLSFGAALLSKEVFLVLLPALIYTVWSNCTKYQRKFIIIAFTYIVVASGMVFVLMAILKGELLPYAWHLPWDHHQHLSMLDTLVQQAQRSQQQGKFSDGWYEWTHADRPLLEIGLITIGFNLLVGLWNHRHVLLVLPPLRPLKTLVRRKGQPVQDRHLLFSLLGISFWLLLVRGGIVLPFYIIPMIPLLALNIVVAMSPIIILIGKLAHFRLVGSVLVLILVVISVPYDLRHAQEAFTLHPTSTQTDAMVWVHSHVPQSAMIVINSYLYLDLREPGGEGVGDGATYPNAQVYWNVAYDPELHDQLLQSNWDRIDYIVADSEMLHDIATTGGPMLLINTALQHSILRVQFRTPDHDKEIVISIYQVVHKLLPPQSRAQPPVSSLPLSG